MVFFLPEEENLRGIGRHHLSRLRTETSSVFASGKATFPKGEGLRPIQGAMFADRLSLYAKNNRINSFVYCKFQGRPLWGRWESIELTTEIYNEKPRPRLRTGQKM